MARPLYWVGNPGRSASRPALRSTNQRPVTVPAEYLVGDLSLVLRARSSGRSLLIAAERC
eukprot:4071282-Pyramimonas_sp.AAC.1